MQGASCHSERARNEWGGIFPKKKYRFLVTPHFSSFPRNDRKDFSLWSKWHRASNYQLITIQLITTKDFSLRYRSVSKWHAPVIPNDEERAVIPKEATLGAVRNLSPKSKDFSLRYRSVSKWQKKIISIHLIFSTPPRLPYRILRRQTISFPSPLNLPRSGKSPYYQLSKIYRVIC